MKQKLKFMLVNNRSRFASKDVWDAFYATLQENLGYEVVGYPVDQLQVLFSDDIIQHHIISTSIRLRSGVTHVIFIGSSFLMPDVIPSIQRCGVKVIYWSLEDPHAFDQNCRFMEQADYYFTNEKAVARKFDKAFYLPTAGGHIVCRPPAVKLSELPDKRETSWFDNEVVFCGNVYPNRRAILEPLLPYFEKHKIKFGIMGIVSLMDDNDDSPLRKHIISGLDRVVAHRVVIMAYGYSKFVINIERDPHYEYDSRYSTNKKYNIEGESLNPRAYEVALCGGGLQLIDSKRKELFEKGILEPDKHCVVYDSPEDLVEKILYYREHEDQRIKIVKEARKHALSNHTYLSRAKRMINIINSKEDRKEDVKKVVLEEAFRKGFH